MDYMDWRLWAHYLILGSILYYALDQIRSMPYPIVSFIASLAVVDILIHYLFGKFLKWKD